ncbi:MAG: hypothetical protein L0I29_10995 [Hyphomicrobiales bacterium]|nr:hypothetical protein [Hyphomicrobiales bacterium]
MTRPDRPCGLLLVTMEPVPSLEEEFNAWYDTEHVPERQAIEGIFTGLRFVCQQGWPRYMALYDLDDISRLDSAAYRACSGENFSPWSRRMISKALGFTRFQGIQIYPGSQVTDARGTASSLLMLRWKVVSPVAADTIVDALRNALDGRAGLMQLRVFTEQADAEGDVVALVESSLPIYIGRLDPAALGAAAEGIVLANSYSRYLPPAVLPPKPQASDTR